MADEPFITRKDLEDVTQKVTIHNSKDIAKPLIDQQKNNDLKELERSIEQRAIFQDIADGIKDLADSLLEGLKGLVPKGSSGFAQILGLGAAGLLGMAQSLKDVRNSFAVLKKDLKNSKAGKSFAGFLEKFKNFFKTIFTNLKNSKLGTFFKNNKAFIFIGGLFAKAFGKKGPLSKLGSFFRDNKAFTAIDGLFKKVFGKGGFFSGLGGFFTKLKDIGKSGPLKSIFGMIKSGGGGFFKLLGKIFWPLTIIFGVIDFYNGFKKGFSEGGIIEGIKQGIQELFDGLIGGLLRILSWIPENIAKLFGLNDLSKAIGEFTETFIKSIKDVFGGLVDLIVSIFTLDGTGIMKGLKDIWTGIVDLVMSPFILMGEAIEDIFDIDLDDLFAPINEAFNSMTNWFSNIGQGLKDAFSGDKIKNWLGGIKDKVTELFDGGDPQPGGPPTSSFNNPHLDRGLNTLGGPRSSMMAMPNGMSSTNNNNNSTTIINNHNFNAPSNLGVEVMQRAFRMS